MRMTSATIWEIDRADSAGGSNRRSYSVSWLDSIASKSTIRTVWTDGDETSGSLSGNYYTFTGRRSDPESELMYFRNRYYSPELGRFLSRDPVQRMNLYSYVGNNPTGWGDPRGKARVRVPCVENTAVPRTAAGGAGWTIISISVQTPWGSSQGLITQATAQAVGTWERRAFVTWTCPACCVPTGAVETNSRIRQTKNSGAVTFEIIQVTAGITVPGWPPGFPTPSISVGLIPSNMTDYKKAVLATKPGSKNFSGTVLRPLVCYRDT